MPLQAPTRHGQAPDMEYHFGRPAGDGLATAALPYGAAGGPMSDVER